MIDIESNPSFKNDIRIYSHSGLANRLRLIARYKHMSDLTNKKIKMYWVKSKPCLSPFSDLFYPIQNIDLEYIKWNRTERRTRPKNTAVSLDFFPQDDYTYKRNHLIFKPLDIIQRQIDYNLDKIGQDFISCHIRRTDIERVQRKYDIEPHPDSFFEDFINSHPDKKVFLATDSRSTQEKFKNKFRDRMVTHSIVKDDGSKRWPHRTTSIREAVVDLFMCINSSVFLGTNCSSFSGFIRNYKEGITCQQEV